MARGMNKLSQLKGILKDFEAKMSELNAEQVLEFKALLEELNTKAPKVLAERKDELIALRKKETDDYLAQKQKETDDYVAQKQKEIEELEKL